MTAFSEMPIGSRVDAQQLYLPNRGEYIRFWHKADITRRVPMSTFGGKVDITRCTQECASVLMPQQGPTASFRSKGLSL